MKPKHQFWDRDELTSSDTEGELLAPGERDGLHWDTATPEMLNASIRRRRMQNRSVSASIQHADLNMGQDPEPGKEIRACRYCSLVETRNRSTRHRSGEFGRGTLHCTLATSSLIEPMLPGH